MSISAATLQALINVTEAPGNIPGAGGGSAGTLIHNAWPEDWTTAAEISPATKVAVFEQALTAGNATIDLRALVGTNSGAIDGNGLKIQAVLFHNVDTSGDDNANTMQIVEGASNGYALFGASFDITLPAGGWLLAYLNDNSPDIVTADSEIDLSGTAEQSLRIFLVMG